MSKFKFTVPGTDFEIVSDTIYKVVPKLDPDAPDGFVENGTTKIIHPNITTSVGAPWDETMKVWNTGFYKASPCYKGMSPEEREALINVFEKHLVKPVEEVKGEGILNHTSGHEFFDNFSIPLGTTVTFNTNDPIQRLQLFWAILGKNLAPKRLENHPNYSKADFCVVNNEDATNRKEEKTFQNTKAIGLFYTLLQSDKEKLFQILEYLGVVNSDLTEEKTLTTVFTSFIEDKSPEGYQNSKIFIETFNKFSTEAGENELYIYDLLKKLHKKGIVKIVRGSVYLDDMNLGNGFKLAATYAATNQEVNQRLLELSEK